MTADTPDPAVPDAAVPDAAVPDAAVPDAAAADVAAPEAVKDHNAGAREYQILGLSALGVTFLMDLQQGNTLLSILLLMVGLLGTLSRMRVGPILFLLGFAVIQWAKQHAWSQFGGLPFSSPRAGLLAQDLAVSMAVLAYVLAQYRLQSLTLNILPPDPRRRSGPRRWLIFPPRIVLQRRPGTLVNPQEVAWFVLGLPVWALLAQVLWSWLAPPRPVLGLPIWIARLTFFGWGLGLGALLAAAALDLWRRRRSPPEVAALYLQDVLWRETRGEQRRLNRWTAWWRMRRK
jgi:hypothetical protein